MSLIQVAAPLIRLAAVDDGYAKELLDAVLADELAFGGLVGTEIQPAEVGVLKPSEWQWFASWRQALGGRLDEVVLLHLAGSAGTRFARFKVRALVLRDRYTNGVAQFVGLSHDVGLNWLSDQVRDPRVDPRELVRDSLQCATEASWFVLRELTSLDDHRGEIVSNLLDEFAANYEINPEITTRWRYEP
jgi:hypothetical protein